MLMLRIRACHVHGRFVASATTAAPRFTPAQALAAPRRDTGRIALPPATYAHEQEKINERWPAALRFIESRGLNEFFAAKRADDVGIVVQGGMYNALVRALERLGLADVYGNSKIPLYVLNVDYPLVPSELTRFCAGKRAVLLVEEGQPELHRAEPGDDPAPGRRADRAARQGRARAGGRIHRRRSAEGHARVSRALRRIEPEAKPVRPPKVIPLAAACRHAG